MKKRYAFLVNAEKCIGCRTCSMACKNYNKLLPAMQWRQLYPLDAALYPHRERAFYSLACNHCENPACLEGCPTASYSIRPDGIVVHNQKTCIGCTNCLRSCPYGVPRYNSEANRVEKCSLCWERIDAGLRPACIQSCPVDAIQLIDLGSFNESEAAQFPKGYPKMPRLNPGTRFISAKAPQKQARG